MPDSFRQPEGNCSKSSATASVVVELQTPDGLLRGRVQIDTGPMRLAEIVPTACELTGVLTRRAQRREQQAGREVSCRAGCGACCRQLVPVSPPEAFYLSNLITTFDRETREAVTTRFANVVRLLEEREMIPELLNPTITDDPVLAVGLKYFALNQACPFLLDETCSIHPHRPVACREYNVTSPPEWCADPHAHSIARVPMPMPLSLPLARMTAELLGDKPQLIPLPLTLRWCEEHHDMGRRAWPGLDLFRCFMDHLGRLPSGPLQSP